MAEDYYRVFALGAPLSEVLRLQHLALRDAAPEVAQDVETWALAARELEDEIEEASESTKLADALDQIDTLKADLEEAKSEASTLRGDVLDALRELMMRPFWAARRLRIDERRILGPAERPALPNEGEVEQIEDPLDLLRVLSFWTDEPLEVGAEGPSVEDLERAREDVGRAQAAFGEAVAKFNGVVGALLGEG